MRAVTLALVILALPRHAHCDASGRRGVYEAIERQALERERKRKEQQRVLDAIREIKDRPDLPYPNLLPELAAEAKALAAAEWSEYLQEWDRSGKWQPFSKWKAAGDMHFAVTVARRYLAARCSSLRMRSLPCSGGVVVLQR